MIGSEVLVFPETGPEALLAIKTAALYAERVQVFSICETDPALAKMFGAFFDHAERNRGLLPAARRLVDYWKFAESSQSNFRLLAKEGLLISADPLLAGELLKGDLASRTVAAICSGDAAEDFHKLRSLLRFGMSQPASVFDLMSLGVVLREVELPTGVHVKMPADLDLAQFETLVGSPGWTIAIGIIHLMLANLVSAKAGVETLCWTESAQDALAVVRDAYSRGSGDPHDSLLLRRSTRTCLVQGIFEHELPMVDDLPLEEILEIRGKHQHELQAFRAGVAELATQIDISASPDEIRLQVADVVSSRVSPAIRNLELSISAARIDALKRIGQSWESVAKATVPYLLSRMVGAPLDIQAVIAALGGLAAIAGPLIAASLERKKLLRESQWSIILRVAKSKSNSDEKP